MRRNVQLPKRIDPNHLGRVLLRVRVNRDSGCWMIPGVGNYRGRVFVTVEGQTMQAHRFMYEALVGPIPAGLVIDHLCGNPGCLNPLHLEPVTYRENNHRGRSGNQNTVKTHCKKRHPLSGQNLFLRYRGGPRPHRECRICKALATRRYYEQRKRLREARGAADMIGSVDSYEPGARPRGTVRRGEEVKLE